MSQVWEILQFQKEKKSMREQNKKIKSNQFTAYAV